MAVGDDKIADFTVDNYAALKLKHPQMETWTVPDPTDTDCFSTSEFFVQKALMSLPNCSSAGLDGILHQVFKNLTAKSNGQSGLNFLRALTIFWMRFSKEKYPSNLDRTFLVRNYLRYKCPMEDFVRSL